MVVEAKDALGLLFRDGPAVNTALQRPARNPVLPGTSRARKAAFIGINFSLCELLREGEDGKRKSELASKL